MKDEDSGLLSEIPFLIKELRNRRETDKNWERFINLLEGNYSHLIRVANLRLIISICDTIADHDRGSRKIKSMVIVTFAQVFQLAEVTRLTRKEPIEDILSISRTELYGGIKAFSIQKQDVFLNLSRRIRWVLDDDLLMIRIWEEVLKRIHGEDTIINELSRLSSFPERYFPLHPEGIPDNYGLTYEDLYQRGHGLADENDTQ